MRIRYCGGRLSHLVIKAPGRVARPLLPTAPPELVRVIATSMGGQFSMETLVGPCVEYESSAAVSLCEVCGVVDEFGADVRSIAFRS